MTGSTRRPPVRAPDGIERLAQKRSSMTDLLTIATLYEEIDNALESLRGTTTADRDQVRGRLFAGVTAREAHFHGS